MKKSLMKFLFFAISFMFSCDKKEEEIYVLPENYIGYVIVIYEQENGVEKKYEGDKRVYEIPQSGILKTQFKGNYGWSNFPEFYYESIKVENKIPYEYDFEKIPMNRVVCFGGTTGTANKDFEGNNVVKYRKQYIGNKEQILKAIKEAEHLDIINIADESH